MTAGAWYNETARTAGFAGFAANAVWVGSQHYAAGGGVAGSAANAVEGMQTALAGLAAGG